MLKTIQIETRGSPDSAIIWLHGLGANGHDFIPIIEELKLPNALCARFIFPHAPVQAVSLNGGIQMPAWFNIFGLDQDSKEDVAGIKSMSKEIDQLISNQIKLGIPANRIVLAGFSQGGALTLYSGLHSSHKLAGLLGISCYLPIRDELKKYTALSNRNLPIFLAHGIYDDVVSIKFAQQALTLLEKEKFEVYWKEYPCGHTVHPDEIADIREWLLKCWQ